MQLLIILALLMLGGKGNAGQMLSEVKPLLESVGGEDIKQALKSAEELSSVISAVQTMAAASPTSPAQSRADEQPVNFPLSPVSKIADRDITYSLSKYLSAS